MKKIVLFCSVSALALCGGEIAFAASPTVSATGHVHRIMSTPGLTTLYSQNDNDFGNAIADMNYTSASLTSFSAAAADDFVVPSGHKWRIKKVDVTVPNETFVVLENIAFYKDNNGLPGKLIVACDNLDGVQNQGSFAITLPKTCKVRLKGGRSYWLSVVANQEPGGAFSYFWETRSLQSGNPAAWENPKNGFHLGCTTWEVMTSCDSTVGPDLMFDLKGKDIVL